MKTCTRRSSIPPPSSSFSATGLDDGVLYPGGWYIERGKGRVAVLLAGHTDGAWKHPLYRRLH